MDDAHLLEGLDEHPLDAEVGEGLRQGDDVGLGVVGGLGRGERLVGRRDLEVLVGGGVVEGVTELELGDVQGAFGRGRVCLRVQRIACLRLRWPHEPARTRTGRGAEAGGQDAGGSIVLSSTFAAPPEGTTTVDVVIPSVGAFTGVALER